MKHIQFNCCYLIAVIKHDTIYRPEVKTRAILHVLCHSDTNLNINFSDTYIAKFVYLFSFIRLYHCISFVKVLSISLVSSESIELQWLNRPIERSFPFQTLASSRYCCLLPSSHSHLLILARAIPELNGYTWRVTGFFSLL